MIASDGGDFLLAVTPPVASRQVVNVRIAYIIDASPLCCRAVVQPRTKSRMKSGSNLFSDWPRSEKDYKTKAANLKRLAGGLRTQIAAAGSVGFSAEEGQLLAKAAMLLEDAAKESTKAAGLAKRREQNRLVRLERLKVLVKAQYEAMPDVADQLTWLCYVDSYLLDSVHRLPAELPMRLQRAGHLVAEMLSFGDSQLTSEALVEAAMTDFEVKKGRIKVMHRVKIDEVLSAVSAAVMAQAAVERAKKA